MYGYLSSAASTPRWMVVEPLGQQMRTYADAAGFTLGAVFVNRGDDGQSAALAALVDAVRHHRGEAVVVVVGAPGWQSRGAAGRKGADRGSDRRSRPHVAAVLGLAVPGAPRPGQRAVSPQPSSVVRVAVERFPADAAAVPAARAATVRLLRGWAFDAATVETTELVVSELSTNAVRASAAGDIIAVRWTATGGTALTEVWDATDTPPAIQDRPALDGEGGRGLLLVEALSTRWAWYPVTTPGGGKVVWSEIHAEWQPTPPAARSEPSTSGTLGTPDSPLPLRTPRGGPEASFSVVFRDDPELLQRIVDRLRALDDWHVPNLDGGPLPAHSRHRGTRAMNHRPSRDRTRPGHRHGEARGRQDGQA